MVLCTELDQPLFESSITGNHIAIHLKTSFGSRAILKSFNANETATGQGFVSNIYRLHLDWQSNGDLPKSAIIKIPSIEAYHKFMDTLSGGGGHAKDVKKAVASLVSSVHKTECEFYEMFRDSPPIAMPKYYAASPMTDQDSGMLILEDLGDTATTPSQPIDGLSYPQILASVTEIAQLHAWSLTTSIDWRSKFPVLEDREDMYKRIRNVKLSGYKSTKRDYPEYFGSIDTERLAQFGSYEFFKSIMDEHREIMDDVLIHGDFWTNNILFEKLPNGNVGDRVMALIDFQAVLRASPAYDLGLLFTYSVTPELRHQHYDDIIKYYYEKVKAIAGDQFKPTYDQLRHLIDRQFAAAVVLALASIPTVNAFMVNSEGDQKEKDEKRVLEMMKDNYDDAAVILGLS